MIIYVTPKNLTWLENNLLLCGFSDDEFSEIIKSLPSEEGNWQPPDFAVETLREYIIEENSCTSELIKKMEEQTVRGKIVMKMKNAGFGG